MKVELVKKTDADGGTWFHVIVDGWSQAAERCYGDALDKYNSYKATPTSTVLESKEI